MSVAKQRFERRLMALKAKEPDAIEDWLYLIHHLHEDSPAEEVHHCVLVDHLGNLFAIEHVEVKGKVLHVLAGLAEDQDVYWSNEEAEAAGEAVPCANRQLD